MDFWNTNTKLMNEGKIIETVSIKIKRGIFKGDSLSPLFAFTYEVNEICSVC
jgi:DUF4097 and DUF4098 domain-containing protein YvlB